MRGPCTALTKALAACWCLRLNEESCQQLALAFAEQRVQKTYLALVRGWLPGRLRWTTPCAPKTAPPMPPTQSAQTTLRCLATLDWPQSYDPATPAPAPAWCWPSRTRAAATKFAAI